MPPEMPSRRSLLATLAALAAWHVGSRTAKALAPPTAPASPPEAPPVIRVAEARPSPAGPFPGSRFTTTPPPPSHTARHRTPSGAAPPSSTTPRRARSPAREGAPPPSTRPAPPPSRSRGARPTPPAGSRRRGGETLGREEYEVVIEGGRRLVRVTTLDASGGVVRMEDIHF